jgi:hypothetical protein
MSSSSDRLWPPFGAVPQCRLAAAMQHNEITPLHDAGRRNQAPYRIVPRGAALITRKSPLQKRWGAPFASARHARHTSSFTLREFA